MSDGMKKAGVVAGLAALAAGAAAFFLGTKKGQEMTKKVMSKIETDTKPTAEDLMYDDHGHAHKCDHC